MKMRLAEAIRHPDVARRGAPSHSDRRAAWRSHTFGDGTCSITLVSPLDAPTAERLGNRLHELMLRGCDRLIVDVSRAVPPDEEASARLAAVFQALAPSCEVVAVVPRDSTLDGLLPARVAVTWSLSNARMLLATHPAGRAPRERSEPGGGLSADDRHVLAVRQVLRWAAQTAGAGDYDNALRALSTIERIDGRLPDDWPERREAWIVASREHTPDRRAVEEAGGAD
jgi:hypothetical protein